MKNVLSIDWDYFMVADSSTRNMMFPDIPNEHNSSYIQDLIWQTHYTDDKLKDIGIDEYVFTYVTKHILHNIKDNAKIMIADSHQWCYDFLEMEQDTLNVVNVDFHHDTYNRKEEIDCGNWLAKVIDCHNGQYTFVARPTSDVEISSHYKKKLNIEYSLSKFDDTQWDMVYVCRSGMWSPPHLDNKFIEMITPLIKYPFCEYEHSLLQSRYSENFIAGIEFHKTIQEQYRHFINI